MRYVTGAKPLQVQSLMFALVIAFNIAAIWLVIEFGPAVLGYLLN